jgi:hypothetical protein
MAVTGCRGGGAIELRRGIESGVDRWSVRHGVEVGGGPAWRGGRAERQRGLVRLEEEERASPRVGWATWAAQADWAKRLGRKSFRIK